MEEGVCWWIGGAEADAEAAAGATHHWHVFVISDALGCGTAQRMYDLACTCSEVA